MNKTMYVRIFLLTLLSIGIVQAGLARDPRAVTSPHSLAQSDDEDDDDTRDKDKKDEEKDDEASGYRELLKDSKSDTQGLFDLHLVKGKLYVELPLSLMGREFLIGSTTSKTSDNGHSAVGSKPHEPMHVCFTLENDMVQLRRMNTVFLASDSLVSSGLKNSMQPAILENMDVKAYSPDSLRVVVDMTDFFLSDREELSPFDPAGKYGALKLTKSFKKDLSFISKIKSFEDNVSISSVLSYTYTLTDGRGNSMAKDAPFTTEMTRSILILPEKPYRPRMADYRIGVFFTPRLLLSSDPNVSGLRYFANRWDIQPVDPDAYERGELTDPAKPIVFYLDDNFPQWWKPYIIDGVSQWNDLFETIGFSHVIQVRDFPKDDPEFDPDNMKYSCIRYVPSTIQNAMGPSWTDPRSGEIITASVYIYNDVMKLLSNWLFAQTAQADPGVRTADISKEKLGDALRYVISHEVGHCLGLMHNMGASHAIPVDSLRSPSFTQQYGTTYSIMDYARFNYVAQPGDLERGVKLTPPRFGEADRYVISWTYKPRPEATTVEEDERIGEQIITDAISRSPIYRYGKQQLFGVVDPRSQSEDLGDDAIRATRYGVANLKYITAHMHEWLADSDPTFEIATARYNAILRQYRQYIDHVANNIGGCYTNEVKRYDTMPRYAPLSPDYQRETLGYMFELYEDVDWLDDAPVRQYMTARGSVADAFRAVTLSSIFNALLKVSSYEYMGDDPFTFTDGMDMLYSFVWEDRHTSLSKEAKMKLQESYLDTMLRMGKFGGDNRSGARSLALQSDDFVDVLEPEAEPYEGYSPVSGFEWQPENRFLTSSVSSAQIYSYLTKLKKHLKRKKRFSSGDMKLHYSLLYNRLDNALQ